MDHHQVMTAASADGSTTTTGRERPRRFSADRMSPATWLLICLLLVALFPAAVVVIRAAMTDWEPAGDQSLIVLRMFDSGTAHTPLLGPWSRFGWDHPGPLLFWVGAPALALAGPPGVLAALGAISSAAVVGTVWAARRLGGNEFAIVVTAAAAVLINTHGVIRITDPWNPWVTVLPLLCYLFMVPAAAQTRSAWAAAVAVATGSYTAQSHLGNAPVVVATAGAGIILWGWTRRSATVTAPAAEVGTTGDASPNQGTASFLSRYRRVFAAVGLVAFALALWSGPIIDQLTNDPGNLKALVEFAADSPEKPEALSSSLGVAARELGFVPAWIGAFEGVWPVTPAPIWTLAIVPLALVVGLTPLVARTVGSPPGRRPLALFTGAVFAAAVFTVTRTTGGLINYVLRWTWPVAVLATAVALLPLVDLLNRHDLPRRRVLRSVGAAMAALVVVVASASSTAVAWRDPVMPMPANDPTTRDFSRQIRSVLPRGTYSLRYFDSRQFSAVGTGTAASLIRHGYQLDFPTDHASRFGAFRSTDRRDLPTLVIVGKSLSASWNPPPGARRLVHWDHLSRGERSRADTIERRVRHDAGMRPDEMVTVDSPLARSSLISNGAAPSDVDTLHELESDRDWYEAWLLPPGVTP